MKKKLLVSLTVLFLAAMAALTFSARSIHQSMIPNVTAKRLPNEDFGGYNRSLAVPKTLIKNNEVFVITTRVVNGEKRDFVRRAMLSLGNENGDYYEVTGGVSDRELVVYTSDRELVDGDEVYIVK